MTFEEFLREKHAKDYHGTDDDMVDAFEEWWTLRYPETMIEYAEEWHEKEKKVIFKEGWDACLNGYCKKALEEKGGRNE